MQAHVGHVAHPVAAPSHQILATRRLILLRKRLHCGFTLSMGAAGLADALEDLWHTRPTSQFYTRSADVAVQSLSPDSQLLHRYLGTWTS